jgi:hypothetical protein
MDNTSGVLRGIEIGAGIALVGGFCAAFTSELVILVLIPVILAALCSFADSHFSFLGYNIGFGIVAVIFALILDTVSPGFVEYLIFYAIIYAVALLPVIFFGIILPSKKDQLKKGTSSLQGAQVPPIYVPEGVEVKLKDSVRADTGKPKTRLEVLDEQSSLTYLCPYCNAQVQATDTKCAACGAEIDHRVTKIK